MINRHPYKIGPKPSKTYHCGCCAKLFRDQDVPRQNDGLRAGILAGLAAGAASKNLLVGLGVALVAGWAGHVIDQEVTPKCPLCGKVLKVFLRAALG